jgi:hypothetical protein
MNLIIFVKDVQKFCLPTCRYSPTFHLKTEIQFPKHCVLFRMMDKVQKSSNCNFKKVLISYIFKEIKTVSVMLANSQHSIWICGK